MLNHKNSYINTDFTETDSSLTIQLIYLVKFQLNCWSVHETSLYVVFVMLQLI